MTDDESVATELDEVVDTSDDEDLLDDDTSLEDLEDESSADESEESPEEDVADEPEPETEEEAPAEPTEEESDESGEDTAPNPEEAEKRWKQEMYQRRKAEKQLREERKAVEQQNLQRYLQEAEDDEVEYNKRQLEVSAYQLRQEQSALTQEKLAVGIDKAVAGIELFRTGTPEMKEELAKSLDDFERMFVEKDDKGNFVKVNADVYQYLQDKADSLSRIAGIGARQQVKQKANEKSRTVTKPVRTPKPTKSDPLLDGFDEEADRW